MNKKNEIKNIYVGPYDIASQARDFFEGFKPLGIKVKFIKTTEDNIYQISKAHLDLYKIKNLIPLFKPRGISSKLRAMGKVVLSRAGYAYDSSLNNNECAMIEITPDNLYSELKKILLEYPLRVKLAKMGREYVKKYHTPSSFCKRILAALEDNKYDFYPTFFREQFIPESICRRVLLV